MAGCSAGLVNIDNNMKFAGLSLQCDENWMSQRLAWTSNPKQQ